MQAWNVRPARRNDCLDLLCYAITAEKMAIRTLHKATEDAIAAATLAFIQCAARLCIGDQSRLRKTIRFCATPPPVLIGQLQKLQGDQRIVDREVRHRPARRFQPRDTSVDGGLKVEQ
jgi:hypothetical protein